MAPATSRRSASVYLSLISKKKLSPEDVQQVLIAAFTAKNYIDCIKNLNEHEIDPQGYIDGLDRIIDTLPPGSKIYHRSLRALRKTCGIYGLLPSSHFISTELTLITAGRMKRPFASGGFSDVWRARDDMGHIFAIKNIRTYEVNDIAQMKKSYCKEVIICKRIRHENVLAIEGVAPRLFELCMISKWMHNGNMLQYVKDHQEVDRMRLLIGVMRGLHHLHSNEVIHGDLKGPNILIDRRGIPLLADFGLSSITKNPTSVNASTRHSGGTIRWSAPELLDGFADKRKRQSPTTKSDVYAISMVIVELYSGNVPFPGRTDSMVIIRVLGGERPPRPASAEVLGMTPAVWALTERCWRKNAARRPDTSEILAHLEAHLEGRIVTPPPSLFRRVRDVFSR